jgi:hypothetical protein
VTHGPSQDQIAGGDGRPQAFDPDTANPARMWNYWVGGKDHYPADREAADRVLGVMPTLPVLARYTRRFLVDVVGDLAGRQGIRQFLDVGTGLPTADNTHQVAQRTAPGSRIVYVDHDPVVLAHARALLTSSPEGRTAYIDADLRDADAIVAQASRTLDFSQPVAVLLVAILHFIPDIDDPYAIVARLMAAVPAGSYLAIAHWAGDIKPQAVAEATRRYNERSPVPIEPRTREQVARFFDGLELTGPGLVPISQWWDPDDVEAAGRELPGHVGVARKP